MKKIFKNSKTAILATLLLMGCSAKQKSVENRPPVIPEAVTTFDHEYGKLRPEGMTFFLWPEYKTENEGAALIAKVKVASNKMDEFSIEQLSLSAEEKQKQEIFDGMKCLDYAVDSDVIDWVNDWKPATDEASQKTINDCIANQDVRKSMKARRDEILNEQTEPTGVFYTSIEPGYPANLVGNLKDVLDKGNSLIEISDKAALKVKIAGFAIDTNTQSTEEGESTLPQARIYDQVYDPTTKFISFKLPEVVKTADDKLQVTGNYFRVEVYRAPNFHGFARFQGDMNLYSAEGKLLRSGSATFYGDIKE